MGLFDKLKENGQKEKLKFTAGIEHTFKITEVREGSSEKCGGFVVVGTKVMSNEHKGEEHDFFLLKSFTKDNVENPGIDIISFMAALNGEGCEKAAAECGSDDLMEEFRAGVKAFISNAGSYVNSDIIVTFKPVNGKYQNIKTVARAEEAKDLKEDVGF